MATKLTSTGVVIDNVVDVLTFYLMNCHETIEKIASNLCNLSKSTYDASVYIDEIQHYQMIYNNRMVKEDLMEIINDEDYDIIEMLTYIEEYLDAMETK